VARLGLSTALADGPRTIEQLAAATGAKAGALRRIIRALAPTGMLRTDGETVEASCNEPELVAARPSRGRNREGKGAALPVVRSQPQVSRKSAAGTRRLGARAI
jgi:hypothetical protein